MNTLEPLVVGSDFSIQSDLALSVVSNWAFIFKRSVDLVYVQDLSFQLGGLSDLDSPLQSEMIKILLNKAQIKLKNQLASQKIKGSKKTVVLEGRTSEVLLEYANKVNASLIALGPNSEKDSLGNYFLGSNSEKILKNGNLPLLLVKDLKAQNPDKILVAIDFNADNEKLIFWSQLLGKSFNADLIFCYVEAFENSNDQKWEELEANFQKDKLRVKKMVRKGTSDSVVNQILEAIDEVNPCLLLMGSRNIHGVKRWLLGSSAEVLVHRAQVSTFIIKENIKDIASQV